MTSPIPSTVANKLETVATVSALFGEGMTVARMNGYRARKGDALVLRSDAESAIALAEKRAIEAEADAALWREHRAKLDALISFCPTCCAGFTANPAMTRDEVIFECGKTVGRSEKMVQKRGYMGSTTDGGFDDHDEPTPTGDPL